VARRKDGRLLHNSRAARHNVMVQKSSRDVPIEPSEKYGEPIDPENLPKTIEEGSLRVGDGYFELDFSLAHQQAIRAAVRSDGCVPNILVESRATTREGAYGFRHSTYVSDRQALTVITESLQSQLSEVESEEQKEVTRAAVHRLVNAREALEAHGYFDR